MIENFGSGAGVLGEGRDVGCGIVEGADGGSVGEAASRKAVRRNGGVKAGVEERMLASGDGQW